MTSLGEPVSVSALCLSLAVNRAVRVIYSISIFSVKLYNECCVCCVAPYFCERNLSRYHMKMLYYLTAK